MSPAGKLRLFLAVRVPARELVLLKKVVEPLRGELGDARWTPPESQHITLKFLGWVPEGDLESLRGIVGAVAAVHSPGTIALSELGAFPNARRARVVWAGVDDREGRLARLAGALDAALSPLGFEPEAREYRPHVTVARLRTPGPAARALADPAPQGFSPWAVESIDLFSSKLSPHGARYDLLGAFPLTGEARED